MQDFNVSSYGEVPRGSCWASHFGHSYFKKVVFESTVEAWLYYEKSVLRCESIVYESTNRNLNSLFLCGKKF